MGASLPAVLPDGPSAVPAPLPARALLRHSPSIERVRPRHLHPPSSHSPANRRGAAPSRDLELLLLQPNHLRAAVDEGEVPQGAVVEDVGLLLVSPAYINLSSLLILVSVATTSSTT